MQDKIITSMQNDIVKQLMALQSKKNIRNQSELYIVEGLRAVNDLKDNISYYVVVPSVKKDADLPVITVSEEIFAKISETKTPQGIMAVVKQNNSKLENLDDKEIYLVLENIQDPGNLGSIIRTAYGLGVEAIFLTKGCVDVYSPKVVRATMSVLSNITIVKDYQIEDYIEYLKNKKVVIFATNLEGAVPVYETDFLQKTALIIGNEANGISEYAKKNADVNVKIPMKTNLESLNVAVATSICLYEILRQRDMM
ncbi:MAG: hypothetical protein BEN19_06795 [Epulopiscium sp. Nuni2H_MBin003]|nr:MAG: hypothetical protein BEN19_06795 [Epulopiscium sp. Nuni2H_MBin003]